MEDYEWHDYSSAPYLQMLVDDIGDVTITNDGATILKLLEVQHPAAKVKWCILCKALYTSSCLLVSKSLTWWMLDYMLKV